MWAKNSVAATLAHELSFLSSMPSGLKMRCLAFGFLLLEVTFAQLPGGQLSIPNVLQSIFLGTPLQKELKDYPRCGRPGNIIEASSTNSRRSKPAVTDSVSQAAPQGLATVQQVIRNGERATWINSNCRVPLTGTQCGYGLGDCNFDAECESDLVCGSDNCRTSFFTDAPDWADCCRRESET